MELTYQQNFRFEHADVGQKHSNNLAKKKEVGVLLQFLVPYFMFLKQSLSPTKPQPRIVCVAKDILEFQILLLYLLNPGVTGMYHHIQLLCLFLVLVNNQLYYQGLHLTELRDESSVQAVCLPASSSLLFPSLSSSSFPFFFFPLRQDLTL